MSLAMSTLGLFIIHRPLCRLVHATADANKDKNEVCSFRRSKVMDGSKI